MVPLSGQDTLISLATPFDQLKVTGNIRLVLIPSDRQELMFGADQNQEVMKFETTDKGLSLKVNSGAHVSAADTLKTKVFYLRAETGGKAELRILPDSISKATVGYWGGPGEKQISTSVGGEVTQLTE